MYCYLQKVFGSFFGTRLASTSIIEEKLKQLFAEALFLIYSKILFFDG